MISLTFSDGSSISDFSTSHIFQTVEALPRFAFFEIQGEFSPPNVKCSVVIDDNNFFNGTVTAIEEKVSPDAGTITILYTADNSYHAYKSDCVPKEFEQATIKQIASSVLSPYALTVTSDKEYSAEVWSTFPSENIFENLDKLIAKYNLVLASSGFGEISIFHEKDKGKTIVKESIHSSFKRFEIPETKVSVYKQDSRGVVSLGSGEILRNYVLPIGSNASLFLESKKRIHDFNSKKIEVNLHGNQLFEFSVGEIVTLEGVEGKFFVFKKALNFKHKEGVYTALSLRGIK